MAFSGSTPLNSTGEFSGFVVPEFGGGSGVTETVASGVYTLSGIGPAGYIELILASTTQTDNVYVSTTMTTVPGPDSASVWPAFGLDGTHFVAFEVILNAGLINTGFVYVNNGGSLGQISMSLTTPFTLVGLPVHLAIGISGTVVTCYLKNDGDPSWTNVGDYDISAYATTGQLATWRACVQPNISNVASVSATTFVWGPITDIIPAFTTVPDVVGEDITTGEADILGASLVVGTLTYTPDPLLPSNQITAQNPVGGTTVATGSAVDLTLVGYTVPDLTNTSLVVIVPAILAAAGLTLGAVTYEASGIVIAGNVIRQSPAPGTLVSQGSGVNVVVSSGPPPLRVPDIYGLTQTEAINAITTLGLVVGAIGSAPSQFVPPNVVQTQNPTAGTIVAPGSIVSFVLSLGILAVGEVFDFEQTVISQYANSPTIIQLVQNLNQYIDQSANFANFYNYVWNVDTAVGFGLDIWGKIVGVERLLRIPNTTDYVGFDNGTRSPTDWQPMGSDQPPYNDPPVGGAMYTGYNATDAYLLDDDAYRQLILAKAFANICTTTAPAINQILQNIYGAGTAWVLNTGPMAISYNLSFTPSAIQLAILEQSGVIPTPPGVSVVINTNV